MPDDAPIARRFFRHLDKPEWGIGVLVDERDGKRTIDFQHGKRHVIAQSFWSKLAEEAPSAGDERAALTANESITKALEPKKGRRPARPAGPKITFDDQLARLAAAYSGGLADARPDTGDAGAQLAAALSAGSDGVVAKVKEALGASGLLHPVELIQLTTVAPENAAAWQAALRDLLGGSGDFAAHFDAVVALLGAKPTWTMSTVFAALARPAEHVFVKPGLFQTQAKILGMPIAGYNTHPSGAVYTQFQAMARAVREKLAAAGHAPRDLMDAYAFIWRTLSPATRTQQPETPGTVQPSSDPGAQPES